LFRIGSRSFFQVNRFLIDTLSQLAVGDAAGGTALDLYAGVGLFTLPLARRFENVQGVDSSWAATRALQFNAERADVNVRVVNVGVEKFLADHTDSVDFAVADPPRAGLGKKVTAELLRIRPTVLSLVSCDPATLARDLQALTAGGYAIEKITLIDLFPQTFHLETVVRLRLG
jgi:23S rRNA (uracil1939-C5)-methyltransferase